MANNPHAYKMIVSVGETPGFELEYVKDGSAKITRLAIPEQGLKAETVKLSIRAQGRQLENAVTRLRRMGWTQELFEECEELARQHRIAGTDPAEDQQKALLKVLGVDPDAEAPADPLPRQRTQTKRHSKTTTVSSKVKTEIARAVANEAPVQLLDDASRVVAEIITPERALDLLVKLAPYQRPVRDRKVADYAAAMRRGEWKLNPGDPICIDTNGQTANGQHRLHAVVEAELPQPFYVAYDVEPDAYRIMDRGAKRSTADMLHGAGEVNTTNLSGVAKLAYLYFNVEQDQWKSAPEVTEAQISAALEAHPNLRESVRHGRIGGSLRVSPTGAMFAHYLMSRRCDDPTLPTRWYKAIAEMDLERGQPGHTLGLYFLKSSPAARRRTELRGRSKRELDIYLLIQGWNNTARGKEMRTISYKSDFVIPAPIAPTDAHKFPPID